MLGESRFEGSGRHRFEGKVEDISVGAEALKGSGEVGLHRHSLHYFNGLPPRIH